MESTDVKNTASRAHLADDLSYHCRWAVNSGQNLIIPSAAQLECVLMAWGAILQIAP
ncbi:MAG: hypothetical protein M3O03_09200 [Pseudomonadota bacterium]|nr:hypothetical protein [Pseudomonadota bacterium]